MTVGRLVEGDVKPAGKQVMAMVLTFILCVEYCLGKEYYASHEEWVRSLHRLLHFFRQAWQKHSPPELP